MTAPPVFPSATQRRAFRYNLAPPNNQAQIRSDYEDRYRSAAPLLPGTGAGGSIERVLQRRMDQITKGKTPQTDLRNHRGYLLYRAQYSVGKSLEFLKTPKLDADRKAYRCHIEIAATLCLAELDRLDLEQGKPHD